MIQAALASSALSGASPEKVLATASEAGIRGVEWSAVGFLDPGDLSSAGDLMLRTLRAGLCSVSYASIFRIGIHDHGSFSTVLETAAALHAPLIRIWTGPPGVGTGIVDEGGRPSQSFRSEILKLADQAGNRGMCLCLGLTRGSILDTYDSAVRLFSSLDHPFIKLAWELLEGSDFDAARESFAALSGRIGLVLARSGDDQGAGSLAGDEEEWLEYLDAFDEQGGSPDMVRHVLIHAFDAGKADMLKLDAGRIENWSCQLRQYHRRRVY